MTEGLVKDSGDGECSTAEWGQQRWAGQTRLKVLYARPYARLMAHSLLHGKVNKNKLLFNPQGYHQGQLQDYSLNCSSIALTGAGIS